MGRARLPTPKMGKSECAGRAWVLLLLVRVLVRHAGQLRNTLAARHRGPHGVGPNAMQNRIELSDDGKGRALRKMRVLVAARRSDTAHLIWDEGSEALCGQINAGDLVVGVVYQEVCLACLEQVRAGPGREEGRE